MKVRSDIKTENGVLNTPLFTLKFDSFLKLYYLKQ